MLPRTREVNLSSSTPTFVGVTDDHHYISRIRRWMRRHRELAGFVIDVLCTLTEESATGQLRINFTQGCAACIEFEEEAQLTDPS
jgi:hypothetical protein